MANRRYTFESVHRALERHRASGALHSVALGENGKRFLVSYDALEDPEVLTLREAWTLVLGLRRGEITYGKDRQPIPEAPHDIIDEADVANPNYPRGANVALLADDTIEVRPYGRGATVVVHDRPWPLDEYGEIPDDVAEQVRALLAGRAS